MNLEQRGNNLSLLDQVIEVFHSEQLESERHSLLREFGEKAHRLILGYSPSVKVRSYSLSYAYPYIEPGRVSTPPIAFENPQGQISIHVAGEFDKDTTPHMHPDSVKAKTIGLYFNRGNEATSITIAYDEARNPVEDTVPSIDMLGQYIEVLDYMTEYYEKSDTEPAPQGYADPRPCH